MLLKSSIYLLSNFNRLEEKSNVVDLRKELCDYVTVVFKSNKGNTGFTSESIGQQFLIKYVADSVFWNRKEEIFVDFKEKEDIENNLLRLNGITVFDNKDKLDEEKKKITEIKLSIKKNAIYYKGGKPLVRVKSSPFLNYYANNKLDFESLQKLYNTYNEIVLWDWGEFGLYFHVLSNKLYTQILKIKSIAEDLGININQVKTDSEVPAW